MRDGSVAVGVGTGLGAGVLHAAIARARPSQTKIINPEPSNLFVIEFLLSSRGSLKNSVCSCV
jgi:hypothetical protein